jgi:hypothetical protein
MASKAVRRLVIDACVARAAGNENATFPASKDCRDFLHSMLGLSHQIVRTTEIWDEWKKHKSNYAKTWLSSMVAQRRVFQITVCPDSALRTFVCSKTVTEANSKTMLKDCHLVEAAKQADNTVVSTDQEVRLLFSQVTNGVGWLKATVWVNPTIELESPIAWLENGASPEKKRCLKCK